MLDKINIIIGKRQTGKTTLLLKKSSALGINIVVTSIKKGLVLYQLAKENDIVIPPILYLNSRNLYSKNMQILQPNGKFEGEPIHGCPVMIDDYTDVEFRFLQDWINVHAILGYSIHTVVIYSERYIVMEETKSVEERLDAKKKSVKSIFHPIGKRYR